MATTTSTEQSVWMDVMYTSVWDGGVSLTSKARYNQETGEVEVLEIYNIEGLEVLERHYITLPYGVDLDVDFDDRGVLRVVK